MKVRIPRLRAGLLVAVATALLMLLPAAPAGAHSALESTDPVAGSRLGSAPSAVTLVFDQDVGIGDRSLSVRDAAGRQVGTGRPYQPGPGHRRVRLDLPPPLATGSYVVRWRVVSVDGHAVAGTFSFGVGAPAAQAPATAGAGPVLTVLHDLATLTGYLGALLLIGVAWFLLVVRPAGLAERRPQLLLRTGWWLSAGSAPVLLALQGPADTGGSLRDLADPALLGQSLETRPGVLLVLRLFVLGLAVAAGPWPGSEPLAALRRNAAALALLFLPTFSLAGHPGEGPLAPVAIAVDAVHLAAAGVWLGGLAVLITQLGPITRDAQPATIRSRWSACAAGAVAVLALTGTFQAWRQVPALPALPGTDYGRALLVKLALVAAMLVVGDQARRRLAVRRSRGWVAAELALGLAVLAATTVLVGLPPARQAYAAPFTATVTAHDADGSPITVAVDVPSTLVGAQSVTLRAYRPDGTPLAFVRATGRLDRPPGDDGPIRFDLPIDDVGRATAPSVIVPTPGTWRMTLQVATDVLTDYTATVSYRVN